MAAIAVTPLRLAGRWGTKRHDCMDAGGRAKQDAGAEESRLAQPKAARRASAKDGVSDQRHVEIIDESRLAQPKAVCRANAMDGVSE